MNGVLEWDLAALQRSLHLTDEEVRAYFTDGRRVSFLLERRLMREVLGGQLARSEGDNYDVLDRDGRKWEVRSVSRGGIYFCPSYMVGSGRRFDCDGFLRKLDEIHGYAISDITAFPRVPYWLVTAADVRNWWDCRRLGPSTQISRDRALALLRSLRTQGRA